jgi:hypothetical protein
MTCKTSHKSVEKVCMKIHTMVIMFVECALVDCAHTIATHIHTFVSQAQSLLS